MVRALKVPDFVIALLEDAVAIGGGLLIVRAFKRATLLRLWTSRSNWLSGLSPS
jgi:hypothetical protein